jgi:hypothetical protein
MENTAAPAVIPDKILQSEATPNQAHGRRPPEEAGRAGHGPTRSATNERGKQENKWVPLEQFSFGQLSAQYM